MTHYRGVGFASLALSLTKKSLLSRLKYLLDLLHSLPAPREGWGKNFKTFRGNEMTNETNNRIFSCPYCGQRLSFLDGSVIKLNGWLHAPQFSCKSTYYVPAGLGEYGAIVGEGIQLREGAKVEFECTNSQCRHNFTSNYNDDLAEILMREGDKEYVVVFHKIYGRHATFLIDLEHRKLMKSFGPDKGLYANDLEKPINFFGS